MYYEHLDLSTTQWSILLINPLKSDPIYKNIDQILCVKSAEIFLSGGENIATHTKCSLVCSILFPRLLQPASYSCRRGQPFVKLCEHVQHVSVKFVLKLSNYFRVIFFDYKACLWCSQGASGVKFLWVLIVGCLPFLNCIVIGQTLVPVVGLDEIKNYEVGQVSINC